MGTQEERGEEGDAGERHLPFCPRDPATVTSCKHEYHVQCILEWAQRSKECPMCWQPLSLKDPLSQELLDVVEQEQAWRHFEDDIQLQQVPGFASYNHFEEQIMQHLAQQLAQRGSLQNPRVSETHIEQLVDGALSAAGRRTMNCNHWISRIRSHGADRHQTNLEPMQESPQRSPLLDDSESLKSRFLVASAKCKETFTRTSRSLKERWRGRSDNAADFRARAQEVSAGENRCSVSKKHLEGVALEKL
ncbi:hypothetical protein GOP47_0024058 [Adiantum capillus-veneris]|uniref:RING-type E3 ubiquitin transferase n=1 Tax=Adiantum capillus-veneris TaxID=13818 RepID=A0A9D4Z3Y1_ADICA|nr:hypothetical protein GOP47_0024058 [Adiantum capillus-veneris]